VNSVGSENLLEQLDIRVAESTAEYRAAGYLRATCFYTYPPDRSEFAARTHRRMRGDLEWNAIENKVAGTEAGYEQTRVTCMVATLPVNNGTELVAALKDELDPTCLLPADASHPYPRIIVASLDVNQVQGVAASSKLESSSGVKSGCDGEARLFQSLTREPEVD